MPVVLDRLPLPNLTWYTGFSILLLAFSVYYAGVQVHINPKWREKYVSYPVIMIPIKEIEKQHQLSNNIKHSIAKSDDKFIHEKSCLSDDTKSQKLKTINKKNSEIQYLSRIDKKQEAKSLERTSYTQINEDLLYLNSTPNIKSITQLLNIKNGGDNLTIISLKNNSKSIYISPYIIPEVIRFMFHEPLCIWTLINMAYCILILLGTTIQQLVFGELRVSEQQHIKDKFWNFVFYKFVFVFGVMNVQAMGEGILWCTWFSILGFLHLLAQLCKDRFEYLSFSPTTPRRTHFRLLGLLSIILLLSTSCLMISIFIGFHTGINTFAFMLAECVLLMVRTLYVISRYGIFLWDISHEGLWDKRGRYIYWTELMFELSELTIDMVHHIHMLVWANMLLTMASLVICMQLRLLFYQLQHKIKSHKNYLRVVRLIKRYPEVSGIEMGAGEDNCAICWEKVEIGRLLNCNHLFHSSCLQAWLHHDLSCPTCRHKLKHSEKEVPDSPGILDNFLHNGDEEGETSREVPSPATPEGMSGNNGWRYVSWLPSFSVEQSHTQLPRHHQVTSHVSTSQLDNLARQVHQMFPDVSYAHILEDLRRTRSIEDTIDNILEHQLVIPPPMFSQESSDNHELPYRDEEGEPSAKQESRTSSEFAASDIFYEAEEAPVMDSISDADSDKDADRNVVGSYFSKSARERERILLQRKEELLSRTRRRFLAKTTQNSSE